MKSKALLSMLIVFIVLAGVWIMGGTIFVVKEIVINDLNSDNSVTSAEVKSEIIKKVDLKGKNILFSINENSIKESIKSVNVMLKVQSIKTEFPNKVVINISKRLPVYTNGSIFFDEDMCVVEGTASGIVDISNTKISFNKTELGSVATGQTERDNLKIEQLKIVADYFKSISGWKISFNDDSSVVGASALCLNIDMQAGNTLSIKTAKNKDFSRILAYTYSTYKNTMITGEYRSFYASTGKIVVSLYVNGEIQVVYREQ